MSNLSKILRGMQANLFTNKSSYPKYEAQYNLIGRTHYVDDSTLKYHHSKILRSGILADGALFYIVTSDSLDMHNTIRGFRYVIFDIFGGVVDRPPLDECFKTSDKASKAMNAFLEGFDVESYYVGVLQDRARRFTTELNDMNEAIGALEAIAA